MPDKVNDGATEKPLRHSSTRRQFLSALGAGVLTKPAWQAANSARVDPGGEARLTTHHRVRLGTHSTELQVEVPQSHYRQVTGAEHSFSETFAAAQQEPYIARIMAEFVSRTSDRDSAIRAAQSLVTRIPYVTDRESTGEVEFIRYPAETLVDGEGDCEDKAILLAGLLSRAPLGCRTGLLIVPYHCATLVAREDLPPDLVAAEPLTVTLDGTEYVYIEAIESLYPGRAASDYGERPSVAAYDGHWTVLNADVLLEWSQESVDRRGLGLVGDFVH